MRILLTNDDGIYAPGLQALRKELMQIGDVVVCAPATEQSAAGHSVTLLWPLIVQEVFDDQKRFLGWAVEGRPADCVKLALVELPPDRHRRLPGIRQAQGHRLRRRGGHRPPGDRANPGD